MPRHDRFAYELVQRALGATIDFDLVRALAGRDRLNMTQLALDLSDYVNGVAKSHAEQSKAMFPRIARAARFAAHDSTSPDRLTRIHAC